MKAQAYIMEGPAGTEVNINGKKYLYFAGTGYFSLQTNTEIIQAANEASLNYGIGSATSRSMAGTTPLLMEIEEKIADFFGTEDAVYLPSGYLSNLAGLKALSELDLYDAIFIDEGSHYSLFDGAQAVGKPLVKFRHQGLDDLEAKLEEAASKNLRPLIASDGLFPVMAKLAPLDDYFKLAEKYNGLIWIDDAHGVGILGENGRGTIEHLGLKSPGLFMGATLSKAFGAYGGMIPGSADFIRQLRKGSVLTGSSAPMNASIAAGLKGLDLVKENPGMREKLRENARYLKAGLRTGLELKHIITNDNGLPILAFACGDARSMMNVQRALMEEGIFIQYTKYQGAGVEGVLRIVVFSTHTKDQIDYLISSLKRNIDQSTRQ